jgi:competence protein ComEC
LALVLRRRLPRAGLVAIASVLVVAVAMPLAPASTVQTLTVTALDVGQGDAILVEVPASAGRPLARILVDGGPEDLTAMRALRARRIRYLDAVVVSHPHADHTDGLPAVLAGIRTGALLVGPTPPTELHDPAPSATATEVVAAQQGVAVHAVAAGQRFELGSALVEVLSPPADGSLGVEPNDNSVVLRVSTAQGSVLLTGDIEEAAQARLLQRPDMLRADILKVPHHGGATNAEGFLEAVGAHTALIGVGADNDYGHPHPDVLADLEGSRVIRTDVHGTVSMTAE